MMRSALVIALSLMLSGQMAISPARGVGSIGPPFNACLVSGWPMNEGSGLTLHDVSANANTATINTGASVVWTANNMLSGQTTPVWQGTGYALASNVSVTNFDGTTPFSIFFWINATLANSAFVGNLSSGTGNPGWAMLFDSVAGLSFNLANSFSASNGIQVTNNVVIPASPISIAFTYDGSKTAAGVQIYAGGVRAVSPIIRADTLTGSTVSGVATTFASTPVGSNLYSGGLAYVAIYNCVLTQAQITAFDAAGPRIN